MNNYKLNVAAEYSPSVPNMGPVISVVANKNSVFEATYGGNLIVKDADSLVMRDIATMSHLVTCTAVSEDGRIVAAGTADHQGLIFDFSIEKGLIPRAMVKTADDVEAVAVDGCHVFFGGQDRVVTASTFDGVLLARHCGHQGTVNGIKVLTDGRIASVGDDSEVHIWRIEKPDEFERIQLDGDVNTLDVCQGGEILTGCDRGLITLVGQSGSIQAHSSAVKAIVQDPTGTLGLSVGYDQKACLFKIDGNGLRIVRHIDLPPMIWPKGACFAGDKILFGSFLNGSVAYSLHEHKFLNLESLDTYESFNSIAVHDSRVYAAGDSGIVMCGGKQVAKLPGPVNALCSAHGVLVAGGQAGHLTMVESGIVIDSVERPINALAAATVASHQYLFAGLYGGAIAQYELEGGKFRSLGEVKPHDNSIKGVAAYHDELCTAAADGTISFDTLGDEGIEGETSRSFANAHTQIANGVSVMADGTFVSVGRDRKLLLWRSPSSVYSVDAPVRNSLKCVSAGPDGLVAVGDYRGMVAVFDVAAQRWTLSKKLSRWGIAAIAGTHSGFTVATFGGELFTIDALADAEANPQAKEAEYALR